MGKYTVFINENMGEVNWEMVKKQTYMALCYVQVMVVKWTGSFGQMRTAVRNWGFRLVYIGYLMP